MKEFARKEWVSACVFEELGQEAVLDEVAARVKAAKAGTARPSMVVFDLDSTLYEVAPRTHAIIREWVAGGHSLPDPILKALSELKHENVLYSLKDTFQSVGLDLKDAMVYKTWETLKDFWWERFFSSAYLKHDVPYPGAVDFVKRVMGLGAHVAYLTGREHGRMIEGTLANLKRDGFPLVPGETLTLLKKDPAQPDAEHKQKAAELLQSSHQVIASFENEPFNVVTLFDVFPNALHVFMESVCSDKPARALSGLYKIRGFQTNGGR